MNIKIINNTHIDRNIINPSHVKGVSVSDNANANMSY